MDMKQASIEDLQDELARRKRALNSTMEPLADTNWAPLVSVCTNHVNGIIQTGYTDDDNIHWIYEAAMRCVYGPEVFLRIKEIKEQNGW